MIILSLLRDDDVVEMTWDLETAFLAVRPVSYTERLLHAPMQRPVVDGVTRAGVALLRRRRTSLALLVYLLILMQVGVLLRR